MPRDLVAYRSGKEPIGDERRSILFKGDILTVGGFSKDEAQDVLSIGVNGVGPLPGTFRDSARASLAALDDVKQLKGLGIGKDSSVSIPKPKIAEAAEMNDISKGGKTI